MTLIIMYKILIILIVIVVIILCEKKSRDIIIKLQAENMELTNKNELIINIKDRYMVKYYELLEKHLILKGILGKDKI